MNDIKHHVRNATSYSQNKSESGIVFVLRKPNPETMLLKRRIFGCISNLALCHSSEHLEMALANRRYNENLALIRCQVPFKVIYVIIPEIQINGRRLQKTVRIWFPCHLFPVIAGLRMAGAYRYCYTIHYMKNNMALNYYTITIWPMLCHITYSDAMVDLLAIVLKTCNRAGRNW